MIKINIKLVQATYLFGDLLPISRVEDLQLLSSASLFFGLSVQAIGDQAREAFVLAFVDASAVGILLLLNALGKICNVLLLHLLNGLAERQAFLRGCACSIHGILRLNQCRIFIGVLGLILLFEVLSPLFHLHLFLPDIEFIV